LTNVHVLAGDCDELLEARRAGAEVAFWNRACLGYAEAVLAGREGKPELAGELAGLGQRYFASCAPWWNHLMHRLVASEAFRDG
jgi:hypothetical protein